MIGSYALLEPFKSDLKMNKVIPFYHNKSAGRCMLVCYDCESKKEQEQFKAVRGLAKKVSAELHKLKIEHVSIVASKEFTSN